MSAKTTSPAALC